MQDHPVVSQEEWLSARKALLLKEKEATHLRDKLNAERLALPWVKVEKEYIFSTPRGKETLADLFEDRSQLIQPMRSVYLSCAVDSTAEAERVHTLLAEGGQIFMPMQETFFAFRFSMLRDKFGTSWMIIHQRPMQ
jgi:hypothetical protein